MIVGSFRLQRGRALLVAALVVLGLAAGQGAVPRDASAGPGTPGSIRVIVQKRAAAGTAPELAVRRLGGQVTRALPIVAGFAATVPATVVGELARLPGSGRSPPTAGSGSRGRPAPAPSARSTPR